MFKPELARRAVYAKGGSFIRHSRVALPGSMERPSAHHGLFWCQLRPALCPAWSATGAAKKRHWRAFDNFSRRPAGGAFSAIFFICGGIRRGAGHCLDGCDGNRSPPGRRKPVI